MKEPAIDATQEIDWAVDALGKEDWGEVMDCLFQCDGELSQKEHSDEQKAHIKKQLDKIKGSLDKVPENYSSINELIPAIEKRLS